MARATGSYPVGHGFKSNSRYHGPLVKRLRHRPFTAVTGVRFSHGSPYKKHIPNWVCAFCMPYRKSNVALRRVRKKHLRNRCFFALSVAKHILPRGCYNKVPSPTEKGHPSVSFSVALNVIKSQKSR